MKLSRRILSALLLAVGLQATLGGAEEVFFGGLKVFVGNLHAHTSFSDGSGFPDEAFDRAKAAGLHFMAVTEHNHTNNIHPKDPQGGQIIGGDPTLYEKLIQQAGAKTQTASFIALFGQEFSSIGPGNHLNVIGPHAVILDTEIQNGEYKKFYQTWLPAHTDVTFIQFNHPWEDLKDGFENYGRHQFQGSFAKLRNATAGKLRTIEVINGPGLNPGTGIGAKLQGESFYTEFLAHGFRLAPSADQDNHHRTWGDLTDARTGVLASDLTESAITEAILARRTFATTDRSLRAALSVNGSVMGSDITAPTRNLTIAYKVADADEPKARYDIKIVVGSSVSGGVAQERTLATSVQGNQDNTVQFTTPHSSSFVYLKVVQNPQTSSKKDHLVSSPVWVRVP